MARSTLRAATALALAAVTLMALSTAHLGAAADPVPVGTPIARHTFPAQGQGPPVPIVPDLLPRKESGVGNLLYHGGAIQHAPLVYLVFWGWHGVDPAGEAPYLTAFFGGVGGTTWAGTQTQYSGTNGFVTNPASQLGGVWYDDTSPLAPDPDLGVADSGFGILAEAIVAAAHFGQNADANYIIATPSGHSTAGFAANGGGYCAWHSWAGSASAPIAYTNLPYQTDAGGSCGRNFVNAGAAGALDGVSIVAGHEYAEAVTDPQLNAWFDAVGYENGDKCAWNGGPGATAHNLVIGGKNYAVQSLWSNAVSACA